MRLLKYGLAYLCVCIACLGQQNQDVHVQEKLPFSDALTATVTPIAGEVNAGETVKFTVRLDRAPHFTGGLVTYAVRSPNAVFGYSCNPSNAQVYLCEMKIPETGAGGLWIVENVHFREGATDIDLKVRPIPFRVKPNPDLNLPTSAEVTINLSARQLLRTEATRLQGRIQQLKATTAQYLTANRQQAVTPLLQRNLADSLSALQSTQNEFLKLVDSEGQRTAADVFFEDLRHTYLHTLSSFELKSSALVPAPHVLTVSETQVKETQVKAEPQSIDPLLALALRPMEQNELAYTVVADSGLLIFDLEVDSTPEGAEVFYYRQGDQPHANPDRTRATIHSLPLAVWFIRFEKSGYRPEVREHDPFRERNHVVHVDLTK